MPTSTLTDEGQTTVPIEVREALELEPGSKLSWEVTGGRVVVTTTEPELYRWEGAVTGGPDDAVAAVLAARKTRGRI